MNEYIDFDITNQEQAREKFIRLRKEANIILNTAQKMPRSAKERIRHALSKLTEAEYIRHAYQAHYNEPVNDEDSMIEKYQHNPGFMPVLRAHSFETQAEIQQRLYEWMREKYPHIDAYPSDHKSE